MRKELKRRINKMMNELQAMKELIDSDALQEQPDNEDVDKVAQELYEHLYELKRRNNVPTNLYDKQEIIDLWKAGIVYGRSHSKQEQPEAECKDLEEAAEESWIYYEYRDSGHLYSSVYKDAFKAGAEWDAEHFRDTTKKVSKDLEEAAKEYDEAESWRYEALKYPRREAFKAGAEWQKRRERLEVDLDDEIHEKAMLLHTAPNYMELDRFACHFYDLGLKAGKEQKPAEIHIDNPNIEKFNPDVKITTGDSSADGKELLYVCDKSYKIGYRDGVNSIKPAEWSEEDEDMLDSCISSIEEAKENRYAYKETDGDTSYDHEIAWLKSLRPVSKESLQSWKPSEDEERLINTSISFLKDFADKGYENAVECIDWLKSKLNVTSTDAK